MSVLRAVATERAVDPDGMELSRLKQKVDLLALITRGWDPGGRVFAPAADDPLFGYHRCERVRCPRTGESRRARALGLCDPCAKNFFARVAKTASGTEAETLEQFKSRPLLRQDQATKEQPLCLVCRTPGHERAARTKGLCTDCCRHRLARRQTVEEFVAGHPRLGVPRPRPSFGRCLVKGCRRWATNDRGFCQVCYRRWMHIPTDKRAASRERFLESGPWQPPLDGWRAAMPQVPELVRVAAARRAAAVDRALRGHDGARPPRDGVGARRPRAGSALSGNSVSCRSPTRRGVRWRSRSSPPGG